MRVRPCVVFGPVLARALSRLALILRSHLPCRGDRKSHMPMHGSRKEFGKGLVNKILGTWD